MDRNWDASRLGIYFLCCFALEDEAMRDMLFSFCLVGSACFTGFVFCKGSHRDGGLAQHGKQEYRVHSNDIPACDHTASAQPA